MALFSMLAKGTMHTVGRHMAQGAIAGGVGAAAWGVGPGDLTFGGVMTGTAVGALTGGLGGAGGKFAARRAKGWRDKTFFGPNAKVAKGDAWMSNAHMVGDRARIVGARPTRGGMNIQHLGGRLKEGVEMPKGLNRKQRSEFIQKNAEWDNPLSMKAGQNSFNLKFKNMGNYGATAGGAVGGMLGLGWGNNAFGNSRRRKHMSSLNHYGEMF